MRRLSIILSVIIIAVLCQSNSYKKKLSENTVGKQEITLPFFNEIQLFAATDLYIKQTENNKFSVEYDNSNGEYVEIEVEEGILNIKSPQNKKLPHKITIYVPDLKSITVLSSGNIYQIGAWNFKSLELTVVGSGGFKLKDVNILTFLKTNVSASGNIAIENLRVLKLENNVSASGNVIIEHLHNCQDMSSNIAGSGCITITSSDTVGVNKVNIAGSGDFHGEKLKSYANYVNIAGSGETFVNPISLIDVSIVGSGDVYYYGKPKLTKSIIGSGKIYHKR